MRAARVSLLLTALLSCSGDKTRRATVPPAFAAKNDQACSVQQRAPVCGPPCPVLYDVWIHCRGDPEHLALSSGNGPSQLVAAGTEVAVVTFDPFGPLSSELASASTDAQTFLAPYGVRPLLRIDSEPSGRTRIVAATQSGGRYIERVMGASFRAQTLRLPPALDPHGPPASPVQAAFGTGLTSYVSYAQGQDPFLSAVSTRTSENIPLGLSNDLSPPPFEEGRVSALSVDDAGNVEAFLWRHLPNDVSRASLHAVIGGGDIEFADVQVRHPSPPIRMVRPPAGPRVLAFAPTDANPSTFEIVAFDDDSTRRSQLVIAPTPNAQPCKPLDCTGACTQTPTLVSDYSLVTTSDGRVWLVYFYTRVDTDVILDGLAYTDNQEPFCIISKTVAERTQKRIVVAEVPTDGSSPQLRWEETFDPQGNVAVGTRTENITVAALTAADGFAHYFEIDPSLF